MNEDPKAQTKMTPVNEETKDEIMTEAAMLATSTSTARTSAQLAKKLKKLLAMDTSTSMAEAIEIDEEEQRKWSRAGHLVMDTTIHTPKSPMAVDSPEIKKAWNDEMPTPHAKAKALFAATQLTPQSTKMMTNKEWVTEQGDRNSPLVDTMAPPESTINSHQTAGPLDMANPKEDSATPLEDSKDKDDSKTPTAIPQNQNPGMVQDKHQENGTDNPDLAQQVKVEPTELLPNEWRHWHDQWPHLAMHATIGNDKAQEQEDLELCKETKQGVFDNECNVQLHCKYMNQYNLWIKVTTGENQVELFH